MQPASGPVSQGALPRSLQTSRPIVPAKAVTIRLEVKGESGRAQIMDYPGLSKDQALRRAAAQGLRVLAVLPTDHVGFAPKSAVHLLVGAKGAHTRFPLVQFSQELLALLEAGLNLTEALATLHAKERQPVAQAVQEVILQGLREGKNFSDVLATRPQDFPEVYVATVRASERTGDLPQALARYIAYQVQFEVLRKKLVSAAIYPCMLLIVGGFVALFLLGYVVPKFSAVYASSGREMPGLSALLLAFGAAIHSHWEWALGVVVSVFAGLFIWLSRPQGRASLLNAVLRAPWLAEKAQEFRLARLYRAVSLLLASGIALPRALAMVGGMLTLQQQHALAQTRQAVDQGQSFSEALQRSGLATPVAQSLIKVGERSGQLADMLERSAKFHDEEFARWVDWASRLLEPILMTIIGVVIGAIVVLMYMPIFELAGSLQ